MLIWITGLSGAGKTTIANQLIKKYKKKIPNLVNIDGDIVRNLFQNDLGFTKPERITQIKRIQRLSQILYKQNLFIIVSALYSNSALLNWNKKNFPKYFEIYLKATIKCVSKRDFKGIYAKQIQDKGYSNIVGIDIPWIAPKKPNLVIDTEKQSISKTVALIIKKIPEFNRYEN